MCYTNLDLSQTLNVQIKQTLTLKSVCLQTGQFSPQVTNFNVSLSLASGRASEGPPPPRLPAAESEPPDASAAEAVESGEKPAGAGVPAAQREPAPHRPQAALAPQTVETRQETRH